MYWLRSEVFHSAWVGLYLQPGLVFLSSAGGFEIPPGRVQKANHIFSSALLMSTAAPGCLYHALTLLHSIISDPSFNAWPMRFSVSSLRYGGSEGWIKFLSFKTYHLKIASWYLFFKKFPAIAVSKKHLMNNAWALTFGWISPRPPSDLALYNKKSSGFTSWSWKSHDLIEAVMFVVLTVLRSMLEHLKKTLLRQ